MNSVTIRERQPRTDVLENWLRRLKPCCRKPDYLATEGRSGWSVVCCGCGRRLNPEVAHAMLYGSPCKLLSSQKPPDATALLDDVRHFNTMVSDTRYDAVFEVGYMLNATQAFPEGILLYLPLKTQPLVLMGLMDGLAAGEFPPVVVWMIEVYDGYYVPVVPKKYLV